MGDDGKIPENIIEGNLYLALSGDTKRAIGALQGFTPRSRVKADEIEWKWRKYLVIYFLNLMQFPSFLKCQTRKVELRRQIWFGE